MMNQDELTLPAWERMAASGDLGPGLALEVGGEPLWWASTDVDLAASAEAAVCLLAPWLAMQGRALQVPGPEFDAAFLENVRSATRLMGSWWGHEPIRLELSGPCAASARKSRAATALFFSGGIDSFYSLVSNPDVQVLVYIVGFDVRLRNRDTWEAMLRTFRNLAQEQGKRFVAVTTNLREHTVLGQMRWARYHGAVLGAAAHLLRDQASRWLLSASYQLTNLEPWGSHAELDWRWSGGGVEIVHFGAELWRAEKLRAMADVDMVHSRLRVCYTNPGREGNCGRCEKCVRTRLVYWHDLPGVACRCMPGEITLEMALDGISQLDMRGLINAYRRFLDRAPPDDPVTSALRALIMRSETGSAT